MEAAASVGATVWRAGRESTAKPARRVSATSSGAKAERWFIETMP